MLLLKSVVAIFLLSAAESTPTITTRACTIVAPSTIDVFRTSASDNPFIGLASYPSAAQTAPSAVHKSPR
jgi:hypothetical protein